MAKARDTKKPLYVWVVIHCEYVPRTDTPDSEPFSDEMVFHVAGSLAAVQKYVKRHGTSEHGWWMVEKRLVDQDDWEADDIPQRYYFNYRGQPRQSPPYKSARRAFDALQRERHSEYGTDGDS
jgi:hypothetical protein